MFCCGGSPTTEEEEEEYELNTGMSMPLDQALNRDKGESKQYEKESDKSEPKKSSSWLQMIGEAVQSGSVSATTTATDLANKITSGVDVSAQEISKFLNSLRFTNEPRKSAKVGHAVSVRVPSTVSQASTADSEATTESITDSKGIRMVDYRSFPLKGYVDLPSALVSMLKWTAMDHYLIIGRPTMAPSAGLKGYKDVTPKKERSNSPFIVVIDEPDKLGTFKDNKYIWVEFALGDTFMLDVSGMKSMDDYAKVLSKKGRWNFKDRRKKFAKGPILHEFIDLPANKEFVDSLWPLYAQTGEKNGFTVLTKEEFFEFHLTVPDLKISIAWDTSDPKNRKMISFCTGVIWRDVIMPMWCGTDYENDLNRSCATYFNILYSYVEKAIESPSITWVDLGASHRKAKMAIGFQPYPFSGYFRCKNSIVQIFVESLMDKYYKPEKLINDP